MKEWMKMPRWWCWVSSFILILMGGQTHSEGQIYINVGEAQTKKSLLAFTPLAFFGTDLQNKAYISLEQELYKIIYNDLSVANYFTFIKPEAYLENPSQKGLRPQPVDSNGFEFSNWKTVGAEFLIRGGYKIVGEQLSFEVYVYHVAQTRQILGKIYSGHLQSVRDIAHTFANDFVKTLTGKPGIFKTKIVVTKRENIKSHKEVYVMDWDAARQKKITQHKSISISPSWSPKGDKISYTAFAFHKNINSRNADLFIYELATHKRWLVSYKKGINSGSSFFPNGQNLLLTISLNGNPDIYRMNLDGSDLVRLTDGPHRALNVEPVMSPDGKMIAFSSDRSGEPMIYTMSAQGRNIKRLTFAGHYNSTPAWSPDGKYLVFAGYEKNHFDLFKINLDGTGLKRLTSAVKSNGKMADHRDPSFSPDGQQIMFTSNRTGKSQIYIMDPQGENERRMTYDEYDWEQPRWSPFLE